MRILFVTTVNPVDRTTGGEIATDNIVAGLKAAGNIVDVLFYSRANSKMYYNECISVADRQIEYSDSLLQTSLWFLKSLVIKRAFSTTKYVTGKYKRKLIKTLRKNTYDAIFIDHAQMAWVMEFLPCSVRMYFISHNVESNIYNEISGGNNGIKRYIYKREARLIGRDERHISKVSDCTYVLTNSDKKYFSKLSATCIMLQMPFSINKMEIQASCRERDLLCLIGTWSWESNKLGLIWFLDNVVPLIDSNVRIEIAGKGADHILEKHSPRVLNKGFVYSSTEFLARANVIAIPSVAGSGIQIKTLEAIDAGAQIVGTAIAFRGINISNEFYNIEDSPDLFAAAINKSMRSLNNSGTSFSQKRVSDFLETLENI